jgi:hypothetical protein
MSAVARALAALSLLAVLTLPIASCGGGSSATTATAAASSPAATKALAKAEANCELMLKEVKHAAHGVLSRGYTNNLTLTTVGFGKPGLRIAMKTRERQRRLIGAIGSEAFETYVGLFDPIILYAERSMKAAEAENLVTTTAFKEKLTTLGVEQGLVAHEAGLPACEIDFLSAMVRAATP